MTISFDESFENLMISEGGYSNHPNDHGGATKYGISLAFLKKNGLDLTKDGIVDDKDIEALTIEQTKKIYYEYFWCPSGVERFNRQDMADKMFNISVNVGVIWAKKILQRAIRATLGESLSDDGIIGTETVKLIFKIILAKKEEHLLCSYRSEAARRYQEIVLLDPSQKVFYSGWLNRAYS